MEWLFSIVLNDQNPKKLVKISSKLNPEDADELTKALRQNADVCACSATDMLGISLEVITH